MLSLAKAERKAARFVKDKVDIDDLHDQLDSLRNYLNELSASFGRGTARQFNRARDYASDAASEAEEIMKDNLAASLLLAAGVGVLIGYFLRRGSE